MKKILAIFTILLSFGLTTASGQFNIKIPKIPNGDGKKTSGSQTATTNETTPTNPSNPSSNSFKRTLPATTILRPSLTVYAERDQRYWKQPETDNFWSWMPKVKFNVTGPIADASFFTFEFMTPDGKPWFSWDTAPLSAAEGRYIEVESEAVPRWQDKHTTIATGTFSFKVTLKNKGHA